MATKSSRYRCTFCRENLKATPVKIIDVPWLFFLFRPFKCPHCFRVFYRPFRCLSWIPFVAWIANRGNPRGGDDGGRMRFWGGGLLSTIESVLSSIVMLPFLPLAILQRAARQYLYKRDRLRPR